MRRSVFVAVCVLVVGLVLLVGGLMLLSGLLSSGGNKVPSKVEVAFVAPPGFEWITKLNKTFEVDVEGLKPGSMAKREFTCDDIGRAPLVSWENVSGAKAYTVIVYDPDAPNGVFYHLIAYNIEGTSLKVLGEALANSGGFPGWYPICPPRGSGIHRYYFLVIAQDSSIPPVKSVQELADLLKNHAVAYGWSMIVYKR